MQHQHQNKHSIINTNTNNLFIMNNNQKNNVKNQRINQNQNNSSNLNIKRFQFVRGLRNSYIQSYKQKIRQQLFHFVPSAKLVQNNNNNNNQNNVAIAKFHQCFQQAKNTSFKQNQNIKYAIQSLSLSPINSITQNQLILQNIHTILTALYQNNHITKQSLQLQQPIPQFIQQIFLKIAQILKNIIQTHLNLQSDQSNLQRLQTPLTKTYHELFYLITSFPQHFIYLFTDIAKIKSHQIARRAAKQFIQSVNNLSLLSISLFQTLIQIILQFQLINQQQGTLSFQTDLQFIYMMQKMLQHMQIAPKYTIKIVLAVDIILTCGSKKDKNTGQVKLIESSLNQRVFSINQTSNIFALLIQIIQNYAEYINPFKVKKQKTIKQGKQIWNYDFSQTCKEKSEQISILMNNLLLIVGRIYSTENKVSRQVYKKNLKTLSILRQYIPLPILENKKNNENLLIQNDIIQQENQVKVISMNDQMIIKRVIFILSNFVAMGQDIPQTYIQSDIYACLFKLYPLVRQTVQQQITITVYNMIYMIKEKYPLIAFMLEKRIIQFINIMLQYNERNVNMTIKILQIFQYVIISVNNMKGLIMRSNSFEITLREIQNYNLENKMEKMLYDDRNQAIGLISKNILYLIGQIRQANKK